MFTILPRLHGHTVTRFATKTLPIVTAATAGSTVTLAAVTVMLRRHTTPFADAWVAGYRHGKAAEDDRLFINGYAHGRMDGASVA